MKLEGRVALVTGGGGGMGGAQCRLFAAEGAAVCVTDLFEEKAQAVADDIEKAGGKAIARKLKVEDSAQWDEVVAAAEAELGPISILCNNAGANFRVSFDDQTEEQYRIIIESMLIGSFLGIKAAIPSMRKAGKGVIINLGSLASIRNGAGSPGLCGRQDRPDRSDALGGILLRRGQYPLRPDLAGPRRYAVHPRQQHLQPERRVDQHRQPRELRATAPRDAAQALPDA